MIGMKLKVRYAQQAAIATTGVENARGPESRVRNDHLGIVRGHQVDGASANCFHLSISAIHLNPIAWLVGVFQYRYEPGYKTAPIVFQRVSQHQAEAGAQGENVAKRWLHQKRH